MVDFLIIYVFFCYLYAVAEGSFIQSRQERAALHWGYTEENGPSTWGGICQEGEKQSPINIELGTAIVTNFPSFVFGDDYLTTYKFYAKNNGHTIYCAIEDDSAQPVIYGGGLTNKFIFQQLHFHWESEHEFEGKRADLEMHLVHYNSKYGSFTKAVTKPDGIVVLAVIFNKSNETDTLIEDFFEHILDEVSLEQHPSHPVAPDNSLPGAEKEKSGFFALRNLLPKHTSRFFRYDGSLTTPGCGEVVQWTVFINRLPVSNRVLEALKTLRDHDGNKLMHNFRHPQKLNGRNVYIQIKNYDGQSAPEFEQINNIGSNAKTLLPIQMLSCCLFMLSKLN